MSRLVLRPPLHAVFLLLCAFGLVATTAHALAAGERTPLIMPGKKTLFQRVITRPSAILSPSPGAAGQPVPPFSIFYVYGRQTVGDKEWVEVGLSTERPTAGWIEEAKTVGWSQSLTVAFNNPSGRSKVIFFRRPDDLDKLFDDADMASVAKRLLGTAKNGALADDSPLIAVEPDEYIDIEKNFYLLPILDFKEVQDQAGDYMRALKVASIPLEPSASIPPPPPSLPSEQKTTLKAGLVFVVDTTISMQPYIDRTRKAINRIYELIRGQDPQNRFHFGLIAFRSNLQAVPRLEYLTKQFHKLDINEDPDAFPPSIANVVEARVSSARFDEDSFAGVKAALEENDWSQFDARYIVVITDAGSFEGNDPLSSTHLTAQRLRDSAQKEDQSHPTAIFVMHLLSAEGAKDHAHAAQQYRALTDFDHVGSLYYPIEGASLDRFEDATRRLASDLLIQADVAADRLRASLPAAKPGSLDERIEQQTVLVGNAMRLAYLGRQKGTAAPEMFEAWTADRDLTNPAIASLDVRVLLTKNQLSDLSDALKLILDRGRANQASPQDFFNQLRAAAAATSRDPRQLGHIDKLRDLVGEYLDGLPYRSEILEMTENSWLAMGSAEQEEKLDTIDEKLLLYREYNADPTLWHSFDGGRVPGDAVCPIPLSLLP